MNQPVRRRSRAWTVAAIGSVVVAVAAVAPPLGIAGGQQGGGGDTAKAPPTVNALVVNGSEQPVPVTGTVTVSSGNPLAVAPRLWQGTPYVKTSVLTTLQSFNCANFPAVPEGQILFVERAITSFNVAPGQSGSALVSFKVLGDANASSVPIPVTRSAPASQVAGLYDGYQGSVEIGVPAAAGAVQMCFGAVSGSDLSGRTTVIGYLVPAA